MTVKVTTFAARGKKRRQAPPTWATLRRNVVASAGHGLEPGASAPSHELLAITAHACRSGACAAEHEPVPSPDRALDFAAQREPRPLPYRAELERRLGRSLAEVEAYIGPEVSAVLASLGVEAAARGRQVFFASPHPDLASVAHEVAHVVQSSRGAEPEGAGGVLARDAAAEQEAAEFSRQVAAGGGREEREAADVGEAIAAGSIAFQRSRQAAGRAAVLEREPQPPSTREPAATHEPAGTREPVGPREEPAAAPTAGGGPVVAAAPGLVPGAGAVEEASAALPEPEGPVVSEEDAAAREAKLTEAAAALAVAEDVQALLAGFASAAPTVKARQQSLLGAHAGDLVRSEAEAYEERLPDLHAKLSGEVEPMVPLAVESPRSREVVLEATPPAPAPAPDVPAAPDPGRYTANEGVVGAIARLAPTEDPAGRAEQIGERLSEVRTTDPDIPRDAGPPPRVPLEGETDVQRLADQATAGIDAGRQARDDARAAVVNGPGPERAQPVQLDEAYAVQGLKAPELQAPAPAAGAEEYLTMGLPPEVQAAFDAQQQEAMQASVAGAAEQVDQAAAQRDRDRQAAVETAQTEAAELARDADVKQSEHVTAARRQIQQERRRTIEAQDEAVADVERDVESRREDQRRAIDDRVAADQEAIAGRYEEAEGEVEVKVAEGERAAAAEKERAEKEAADQSWWERAVSFVRSAFNALVSAIGKIFDKVRAAVDYVLDKARGFALAVIDAAASFVKGAIAAFGEFLKGAVSLLIGQVFPELAAALNEAIDGAVAKAQGLVDRVAEGLKAGVNTLVEGLKAGLNAVLDVYQSAIDLALGAIEAALTGDWSALARKVLEAVLAVIGVDPESFYAFIGRAEETFRIVLNDPGGFVGRLVDSFVGGVERFAGHFLTHLQAGIVGWLTGTLGSAGITPPQRFDLWGVLDLVRQVLGLTWERLRQKAVRLVGERNVARLEYVYGYIETLVQEGWGGLWQRIQNDLATLRDQVLDGIKTLLLERVVLAAITKLATMFNPVGALVQLVLTAWNVYTFLRDQLQRVFEVFQAVLNAIGDIARGILDPAKTKVEEVLGRLLPLALDLLARLLGLGNVGGKVREVIEKVQETVDRAIDALLQRVLAAFRGEERGAATNGRQALAAGGEQERVAAGDRERVDAGEQAVDPAVVKREALDAALQALEGAKLPSLAALEAVVERVYRQYQPRGLKSLAFRVTDERTMAAQVVATASEPVGRYVRWSDIFQGLDVDARHFQSQGQTTYAAISVNRQPLGDATRSGGGKHAEEVVIERYWTKALASARESVERGEKPLIALAVNRSPCHIRCSPLLFRKLHALDADLKRHVRFVLAPTGIYESDTVPTEAEIEDFKKDLAERAKVLGRPAEQYIKDQMTRLNYTTTGNDLRLLTTVGWDLAQLLARPKQTGHGKHLARFAHRLAGEAGRIKAGG